MVKHVVGKPFFCFLDGFLGFYQIPFTQEDQEKITSTCTYGMNAFRKSPPHALEACTMGSFVLEKFNLIIKDRKGADSYVADHLSRIMQEEEIYLREDFPNEDLFQVNDLLWWYTNIVNYLVMSELPFEISFAKKCKLHNDVIYYF